MLSAQDFEFRLPSDLGVPNLDQLDFSAGFAFGDEDGEYLGASGDDEDENEDESSAEGEEGEEEGEEGDEEEEEGEEEEEEEVPLLAKGAASGVRPDSENPQPVSEAGGTTQDAREGGEEDRSAATAMLSEARSGVESVPIVPTAAEGDRLDEAPLVGETTMPLAEGEVTGVRPRGGAELAKDRTPLAAEADTTTMPLAEGEVAGVQPGGSAELAKEKTPLAVEADTPEALGRVQLGEDVTPPAPME